MPRVGRHHAGRHGGDLRRRIPRAACSRRSPSSPTCSSACGSSRTRSSSAHVISPGAGRLHRLLMPVRSCISSRRCYRSRRGLLSPDPPGIFKSDTITLLHRYPRRRRRRQTRVAMARAVSCESVNAEPGCPPGTGCVVSRPCMHMPPFTTTRVRTTPSRSRRSTARRTDGDRPHAGGSLSKA